MSGKGAMPVASFGTFLHNPPHYPTVRPTLGWEPSCDCDAGDPVPCVVMDPFAGSGTVGVVAASLGRDYVLIEISPDYAEMCKRRIYLEAQPPLFPALA